MVVELLGAFCHYPLDSAYVGTTGHGSALLLCNSTLDTSDCCRRDWGCAGRAGRCRGTANWFGHKTSIRIKKGGLIEGHRGIFCPQSGDVHPRMFTFMLKVSLEPYKNDYARIMNGSNWAGLGISAVFRPG